MQTSSGSKLEFLSYDILSQVADQNSDIPNQSQENEGPIPVVFISVKGNSVVHVISQINATDEFIDIAVESVVNNIDKIIPKLIAPNNTDLQPFYTNQNLGDSNSIANLTLYKTGIIKLYSYSASKSAVVPVISEIFSLSKTVELVQNSTSTATRLITDTEKTGYKNYFSQVWGYDIGLASKNFGQSGTSTLSDFTNLGELNPLIKKTPKGSACGCSDQPIVYKPRFEAGGYGFNGQVESIRYRLSAEKPSINILKNNIQTSQEPVRVWGDISVETVLPLHLDLNHKIGSDYEAGIDVKIKARSKADAYLDYSENSQYIRIELTTYPVAVQYTFYLKLTEYKKSNLNCGNWRGKGFCWYTFDTLKATVSFSESGQFEMGKIETTLLTF